jgi:hypothetical protein
MVRVMNELRPKDVKVGPSIFNMTPAQADSCGRAAGRDAFDRAMAEGRAVAELVDGKVVYARRGPDAKAKP